MDSSIAANSIKRFESDAMTSKLIWALGAVFVLLLLPTVFLRERWTTPVDELKTVLAYYKTLEASERFHFKSQGRYVELGDLFGEGSGKYRITSECQGGYCFQVQATGDKYSIRVFPNKNAPNNGGRLMSLYADETGVVRTAYGSPQGDSNSSILAQDVMRRFETR